jgi:hypothetical protein
MHTKKCSVQNARTSQNHIKKWSKVSQGKENLTMKNESDDLTSSILMWKRKAKQLKRW